MGLFGKKQSKSFIPPVETDDASSIVSSRAPSYQSQDPGPRYGQQQPNNYPPSNGFKQPQTSQYDYESSRRELFQGARPVPTSQGADPYASSSNPNPAYGDANGDGQLQNEDEEVDAIKQQMRFTKQESLASTRNALRAAREAEETARGTLTKLGDQTERIANTERAIDMTKAYNDRAQDEAKEIQSLNRSIFRPNIGFNKQRKRDMEEQRIMDRHHAEREQREDNRREVYESRERVDRTFREAEKSRQASSRSARYNDSITKYGGQGTSKLSGRARYQFEADEEDDQVEQELDDNLDEISQLSKRLNLLARAAGDEVRAQNVKLTQLNDKTDMVDSKIFQSTQRLGRIK